MWYLYMDVGKIPMHKNNINMGEEKWPNVFIV